MSYTEYDTVLLLKFDFPTVNPFYYTHIRDVLKYTLRPPVCLYICPPVIHFVSVQYSLNTTATSTFDNQHNPRIYNERAVI
jgi:hypothetical protein